MEYKSNLIFEASKMRDLADAIIKKYSTPPKVTEGIDERSAFEQLLYSTNLMMEHRMKQMGLPTPFSSMLHNHMRDIH